jgi:hypothetical protein
MAKAVLKRLQKALGTIKGGFTGPKHRRNEEQAVRLSVDVQCGEKRIQVKFSKKWQKMKRRIMREFGLKWKRWALFVRDGPDWVKLQPPYGSLTPGSSYRLVIRTADQSKRPRPGISRRRERRQAERETKPPIEKPRDFEWSATDARPNSLERSEMPTVAESVTMEDGDQVKDCSSTIVIQRRSPSPPLRIDRSSKASGKVLVDLVYAGQLISLEVLKSATQRDIEIEASEIFPSAINIYNFSPPVKGIKYKCGADYWGNKQREQEGWETESNGGAPGSTQRKEAEMEAWRTARDARKKEELDRKKASEKAKADRAAKRTGPRSRSEGPSKELPELE